MYIKRINNVVGYKGLEDGFNADFSEDKTYIIGANFQKKTTVGSLFNWCLTGTSLFGKEKDQVANDMRKVSHVIVDITFVDNYGIEHRLIRDKGKEINLILDGKEIKQEMLAKFYQDKDVFLVAHNPYYFYSLEPKDQKDLLRKIVPGISSKDAFKFLTEEEQQIIGVPIESLNSYTDQRNEIINELKKEYDKNCGQIEVYKKIALNQEGELLSFDKEIELQQLKQEHQSILSNIENYTIEDLQKNINKLDDKINEIFQVKLLEITKLYDRENKKLINYKSEKAICSSCRQEIKDFETRNNLVKLQQKELDKIQQKANELKKEASMLINEKKKKTEIFEKLNTKDIEQLLKYKKEIEEKINILQEEKNNIILHNKEVQTRQEQVKNAKNNIVLLDKAQEEILSDIAKTNLQKKIANKLKVLVIEKQQEMINKYLNKVNIVFSKINKSNEKIIECCDIQYEGRDYKKLSKSQQVRACLELSNVFNNLSGIKAPVFLDDAESTTDIQEMNGTQMIISLVIKYAPLEILYDYDDVLDRKQKSVEKEKIEINGFFVDRAAA